MKICPQCLTQFDDKEKFCNEDGTPLVDANKKKEDPLIGQFVDKDRQYQIVSVLGEGGMGKVYKGRQVSIGRDVAIKTLHREMLEKDEIVRRFINEGKAATRFKHQNAIDILMFGQIDAPGSAVDKVPYLVMEFVSGDSLSKRIRSKSRLAEDEAIHIMLQVCEVLESAHKVGIIHRDLKPDNIVLTESGRNKNFVKVLDFGIAKLPEEKLTQAGMVFGTPEYLSPEQAAGKADDPRSDIYSLGIILYEMLSGKVPFKADTAMGFLIKHVNEPPVPLRQFAPNAGISEAIERVVMKALSKEADQRQQNATELYDELKALSSGSAAAAVPLAAAVAHTPVAATMVPGAVTPASLHVPPPTFNPPPPSQTSMASVQTQPVSQGSSSGVLFAALLALLLGGGGAGYYFFVMKPKQGAATSALTASGTPAASSPATASSTPPVVAAKKVRLNFTSTPTGAEVLFNGTLVGLSPLPYETDSSATAVTVTFQKEGFVPVTKTVMPSSDQEVSAPLVAAKGGAVTPTPTPTPNPTPTPTPTPTASDENTTATTVDPAKKRRDKLQQNTTTTEETPKKPDRKKITNILDSRLKNGE